MRALLAACALACLTACRQDMNDQAHHEPLERSEFFADGAAARRPPPHTMARGELRADSHFYEGRANGELATELPAPITKAELERGRERYDIYCAPCHGRVGDGHGMIAQRGFPPPPTFHQPRLREAPVGHFYEVITRGWGVMYPYAARVSPEDRWAITAYIRVLQFSQNATLADADPAARATLEGSPR